MFRHELPARSPKTWEKPIARPAGIPGISGKLGAEQAILPVRPHYQQHDRQYGRQQGPPGGDRVLVAKPSAGAQADENLRKNQELN